MNVMILRCYFVKFIIFHRQERSYGILSYILFFKTIYILTQKILFFLIFEYLFPIILTWIKWFSPGNGHKQRNPFLGFVPNGIQNFSTLVICEILMTERNVIFIIYQLVTELVTSQTEFLIHVFFEFNERNVF